MYRQQDNPPSRFPEERPLEADMGIWMVACLLSRCEKAVATEFCAQGMGYYLPLFEKKVRRKDNHKLRKTIVPLFPGYIAFAGAAKDVLTIQNIARVLPVKNQRLFVAELLQIQRILNQGADVRLHARPAPGARVRVAHGPFSGIEGGVISQEKETRLQVGIEMFGQAVSIRIEEMEVEKIR